MGILAGVRAVVEHSWLPIERTRLALSGHKQLARALGGHPCALAPQIERRRAEMLKDGSQLADGSLGPAGLYDEGRTVAEACLVSRSGPSARLIYSLAAEYQSGTILELGTNVGISSAYLAAAGGRVTTLESSPYRLRLAKTLHQSVGLDNVGYVQGLFSDTLEGTLTRLPPIEMAFIDGHHQYAPTLEYFRAIFDKCAPKCLFIFDDIRWSGGMRRAWAELRADRRFEVVADLGGMGVCISR